METTNTPEKPEAGKKPVDLVLEGGGVKGIALVGALAALEEDGYEPQNIAGTSVGAIVGALLASGYTTAQLRDIMINQLDFRRFKDKGLAGRLPLLGQPLHLFSTLGFYKGKAFEKQMAQWLLDSPRQVRTFKQLPYHGDKPTGEDRYSYRLQVITSDIAAQRMLVLPRDAHMIGRQPDSLSVAHAVRMSMSVPFFFEPVRLKGPGGKKHLMVDGGLLSNFPVWLFDSPGIPDWPTFGLHLMDAFEFSGITNRIPSIGRVDRMPGLSMVSYLQALVLTTLDNQNWLNLEKRHRARTIGIETVGVGVVDFDISDKKKNEIYDAGYTACRKFLATWDFEAYKAGFRRADEPNPMGPVPQLPAASS